MVTWPANMPAPAREFVSRQVALREKLRWVPRGSKRRQRLEAELADIVQQELRRETEAASGPDAPESRVRPQWWKQL